MSHIENKARTSEPLFPRGSIHRLGSGEEASASYSQHYETNVYAKDRFPIRIRAVKPTDALLLREFFARLSTETIYFRFLRGLKSLSQQWLDRFTRIDYERDVAMAAVEDSDAREKLLAICHIFRQPGSVRGEVGIVVDDQWQGKGIGTLLLRKSIQIAGELGMGSMWALVSPDNRKALVLARQLGFVIRWDSQTDLVELEMTLDRNR
jgi:acetyltransferase